jgi:hypothetical protein
MLGGQPLSAVLARARRFAACVRRYGIPNLPAPKISSGQVVVLLPAGLNPASPRVQRARRACQKLVPQPPAGRTG